MTEVAIGWIVARTRSQREQWAAENLSRQGFEYYLPKIEEITVAKGQRFAIAKPLFPSYIFVRKSPLWRAVLGTFGVISVLLRGGAPELLSDVGIEQIKSREDQAGLVRLPKRPVNEARFTKNQKVRINDGSFSGYEGLWQGSPAKERERVLLEFLGRKITVLIGSELIEAA